MSAAEPFEKLHRNGSLWTRGQMVDGLASGEWQWFRKDGTLMRSGHFEAGEQVGEWVTYGATGAVYKVTQIRAG